MIAVLTVLAFLAGLAGLLTVMALLEPAREPGLASARAPGVEPGPQARAS